MGHKSKASMACLDNLRRAPPKSHHATVEDASDSDAEDADYTPACKDFDLGLEAGDLREEEQDWSGIQENFYFLKDDFSDDGDLPDMDYVSDSDLEDMELDDEEEADIKNDAALLAFSSVLRPAQEIATTAERKNGVRGNGQSSTPRMQCTLFRDMHRNKGSW
jgi:hypothetical protein